MTERVRPYRFVRGALLALLIAASATTARAQGVAELVRGGEALQNLAGRAGITAAMEQLHGTPAASAFILAARGGQAGTIVDQAPGLADFVGELQALPIEDLPAALRPHSGSNVSLDVLEQCATTDRLSELIDEVAIAASKTRPPTINPDLAGRNYEVTRVVGMSPTASWEEFQPQTGIFVTERDAEGRALRARVRVLVDHPSREIYVVGEHNDWGANLSDSDRLFPVDGTPYYEGEIEGLRHGMEYRVQVDGQQLLDPAASLYTTPGYLERAGREGQPAYLNSVFWDFGDPAAYQLRNPAVDLRTQPAVIGETELYALAEKWEAAGRQGPPTKQETYKFITESGIIDELQNMGYNAIELLPFNAAVDGNTWQFRYLVYGNYAVESGYGTPDEFARMIDRFNEAGIAVIMDAVVGHYPASGNQGIRELSSIGLGQWRKGDGRLLFGDHSSPWGTNRYDYENPAVRRFLIDAIMTNMKRYRISGIRFDNLDGIRFEPGGGTFLQELVEEIRRYQPETVLIPEMFFGESWVLRSQAAEGAGLNMRTNSELFDFFKDYVRKPTEQIDLDVLRNALRNPWEWGEAPRVNYLTTHDEAANGRGGFTGEYPATMLEGGGDYFVKGKTKAFASLAMLSGPAYLDLPQLRLLQRGNFSSNPGVEWGLRDSSADVNAYFSRLSRVYRNNPAFAVHNLHGGVENHVDNVNKVISLERIDSATGRRVYVVANLGHQPLENYRFGIEGETPLRISLDSDQTVFGGSNRLRDSTPDGMLYPEQGGEHGKAHSVTVPYLAPYSVTVLAE